MTTAATLIWERGGGGGGGVEGAEGIGQREEDLLDH